MTPPLGSSAWRRLSRSDGDLLRRAVAMGDEATRLSRDGRPQDALILGEQAVAVLRQLMVTDRERTLPFLGPALRNRAIGLRQLGRLREAVRTGQEGLELSRDARMLSGQAELLRKTGASREALALTTEALALVGPEPTAERGVVLTQHMQAQGACGRGQPGGSAAVAGPGGEQLRAGARRRR